MGGVVSGKQEEVQKQTTQTSQSSYLGWGIKDGPILINQSNIKEKDQVQEQNQDFFTKEQQARKKQIEEWNINEKNKTISRQQSEVQIPQNQNNDKNFNHSNTLPEQKQQLVNPLCDSNNPSQDFNNPLYQSTPSIFMGNDKKDERQKTEETPIFNRQKVDVYDSKVQQQIFQFNENQNDQQQDQNNQYLNNKSLAQSVYINNDSQTQQLIQQQNNNIMVESQPIKNSENKQPISFMPDSQKVQQPDSQKVQQPDSKKQLKINIEKSNAEKEFVFGTQLPGVSPDLKQKKSMENNSTRNTIQMFGSQIEGESPWIASDSLPYKDIQQLRFFNDLPKIIQEILQEKGLYQPKELKKSEKTATRVLKQPDGSMYEGQLENNQRHGYGMFWCNDEFYEGYFEKNERSGWGRVINLKKELKSGYWQQKSIQKEMYYESDLTIYDGKCRNSLPHGRGILERKGEFKYEGTFSDGKLSGQGIKINIVEKTSYEGEFYNDVIQGYGTFKFSDGKRYQGQFEQNKFQGNGEMFWPDGRYYKGQFFNNFRHGQGYYRDKDGSTYEGGWINNKKQGMGKAVVNGLEIVGQWIDDVFQEQ